MERVRHVVGRAILTLVGVLLVEVMLEEWIVVAWDGDWVKTLKSALYITLFVLTIVKVSIDQRWHEMRSKADIALVVLGVVLVVAGVAGGSPPVLIGEALFVYFRGVIVFYAFRAVKPSWEHVKPLLWIAGGLVAVCCLLAVWQLIAGRPAYVVMGWENLKWAGEGRVHGLLDHPNHLGHVTGLAVLGLVAWFAAAEKIAKRWWLVLALFAFVLGMAQSRQSTIAALAGIAVIAVLRRGQWKRVVAAGLVIGAFSALPLVASEDNRAELAYRMKGVLNAFGADFDQRRAQCATPPDCDGEVRVLFIKQGLKLWTEEPLLGYGVGQFGGIVAVKHDPQWNMDPRFVEVLGDKGFDMYDFKATSVDVFWLHLLVEAGALGLVAYLVWMCLVAAPLLRAAWRRSAPARDNAVFLWSMAVLAFAVIVAAWSPSLEDQLFPPLIFAVLGWGWVLQELGSRRKA